MNNENEAMIRIIGLIIRIIITVYCVNKAKRLNRNTWGWGLFAFFIPIIALIWIQFMKPIEVLAEIQESKEA
jgi:hypothetical protein